MTNTNKLQIVEAGLELETKLNKQLWDDMWGETISSDEATFGVVLRQVWIYRYGMFGTVHIGSVQR